jgi:DNA polymerase-1
MPSARLQPPSICEAHWSRSCYRSALLLQVHDELLLESPPEELAEVTQIVKREMEEAYPLAVPLLVDIGCGANWRDAKGIRSPVEQICSQVCILGLTKQF